MQSNRLMHHLFRMLIKIRFDCIGFINFRHNNIKLPLNCPKRETSWQKEWQKNAIYEEIC